MYWYKKCFTNPSALKRGFFFLTGLWVIAGLGGCRPDLKQGDTGKTYFDIAGFFKADAARLNQLNPAVAKTVTHNGATQSKALHINGWDGELELFINSDINKPAWRQSYTVTNGNDITIYHARTPELKTQKIILKQLNGKVKWVYIYNHTKNVLYENYEDLSYYPDSVYLIKKWQHVRLLGVNRYDIRGEIKK